MASTMKAWRTYKYNEDVPAAIGALKLEVPDALSKSLTARSGGKLVIDVASPAPSESCCVVA